MTLLLAVRRHMCKQSVNNADGAAEAPDKSAVAGYDGPRASAG
jgi:hypothetical protein